MQKIAISQKVLFFYSRILLHKNHEVHIFQQKQPQKTVSLDNVPKITIYTERLKSSKEIYSETVYWNTHLEVFQKIANLKTLEKFFKVTFEGIFYKSYKLNAGYV